MSRLHALAVVVAAAITLAGCGSDDGPREAGRSTSPPASAVAPTDPGSAAPSTPSISSTPSSPAGSSKRAERGCKATVRYAGGQGGTGQITARFRVEVAEGRRCRFRGRPAVRLIDEGGEKLKTNQSRDRLLSDPSAKSKAVVVRAGEPAQFEVIYRYATPSGRGCREAAGISVRLPTRKKRYEALVRPGDADYRVFTPCNGDIAVTPIHAVAGT